ncbi:Sucrose-6-phosphate hydrolase SacC, GH32 family [Mucilaginibacter pineti]|uniref:beta-fructofuranosidase n=1 Tax=Mucilaginibacter pineti TaxID=1391627 RepID=A0A1G7M3N2_9SPHI|nr:family 43 glycosylhydrolase [Mucilaginibacter pineti]SDF56367.1 Sucrose-6-phosphate hydrolase SacC, GH32 family [Mucilaginibacter pineti]
MKKLYTLVLILFIARASFGQLGVKYDPTIQSTKSMQYFKPKGNLFVGDCIPFSKDGVYYYYWLLDSAHHKSLNGLGGHQWALSKSDDLKTWKQYPLVLKIDEPWEKSICTGSVVFYKGKYYAFYATRLINDGKVNEQLSYAISADGVNFEKQKPNPFYTSAPGYSKRDFRDPKVFVDEKTGEFHLFVSSWQENTVMKNNGGALVHLSSKDLKNWTVHEPILTGQASTPECPDYFLWKGWYYLVYSDNSNTSYVKSKKPYGPWEEPRYQALNEDWSNVVKTAEFKNDRRIAAAWVPSRWEGKDSNGEVFGGNSLFREVIQEADGTLDTRFPAEMVPETGEAINSKPIADLQATLLNANSLTINSPGGVGAAHIEGVPLNCRITLEIEPLGANEEYGIYLRAREKADGGYQLNFSANNKNVELGNTSIQAVDGLNKTIKVDIVMKDGIIDVDIDHKRTIINRTYEQNGNFLWFYAKHGKVNFKSINIYPLKED